MNDPKPTRPAEPTFDSYGPHGAYNATTDASPASTRGKQPAVVNTRKLVLWPTMIAAAVIAAAVIVPNVRVSERMIPVQGQFTGVAFDVADSDVQVSYGDVDKPRLEQRNLRKARTRIDNGVLRIEADRESSFQIGPRRIELTLPLSMQATRPGITVQGASGDVTLRGDYGAVDIATRSGDAEVRGSWTSAKIQGASGDISVEGSGGPVELTASSGRVDAKIRDTETVQAKASSGSIRLDTVNAKTIRVEAASGSVRLDAQGAQPVRVEGKASSGSVDLDVPDGSYKVSTRVGSGSSRVDVGRDDNSPHSIDAQSGSGDVRIH